MNPIRIRNGSAAATIDHEYAGEPPAQRRRTSYEASSSASILPPRPIPAAGSPIPRASRPQAGTTVATTSATSGTRGASANPDASRAAIKRYMISHFGLSPEEAEKELGNVSTPQPGPGPMLAAASDPSRPSPHLALIGGAEDRQEGLDQVAHPHATGVTQQTALAQAPSGRVWPKRAEIAARIKAQIPMRANEYAKDWAHRICETDEEIQNIEHGRLRLLSDIVNAPIKTLSCYPLLGAPPLEVKQALEIKARYGQAAGEHRADWARRLATIPELQGVEEKARYTVIARVTRCAIGRVKSSFRACNAPSAGSAHDLAMRVAGISHQELEEAFSDVERQPFVDSVLLPAITSVARPIAAAANQAAGEDEDEMIDELLATSGGMILPHETDPLQKTAQEVAKRIPKSDGESAIQWAHRICETEKMVESCGNRSRLLEKITGTPAEVISRYTMLTAKEEEIEQALKMRSRLPRLHNESNRDWARRLARLEDFNGKALDEIKLPIARIVRDQACNIKLTLSHLAKANESIAETALKIAEHSRKDDDESYVDWAHRICETMEIVQTLKQRAPLLGRVTGKKPKLFRNYPMLLATKEEIIEALEIRNDFPRGEGETRADWARRLSNLETLKAKTDTERVLTISRIIRGRLMWAKKILSNPRQAKSR